MKQLKKTLLTLVALLAVTTGAWATEFTSLKVGDVLHVGDAINTGTNYKVYGLYLDAGNQPATLVRANIGTNDITESETGAYYLIKGKNDFYFGIIWGAEGLGGYWPVTDTSDGISVTAITPGDYTELTFAVHEGTATPVDGFAWNKAEKTGTFTMPGGNVTLEPDYYPQATVADGAVTAADADARATTDDPLVKVDATKLTGAKKLMYFVSNSGTTAPAYDAEGWTDQLPTAEGFTQQGIVYVWYYPVGIDEGVDGATATYSDGDICLQSITARIAPEPTYAVTFAEGTDPNEWTASPNADVKKGQTVTVTYSGSKKVIGVKAEKKAKAPAETTVTLTTGEIGDLFSWDSNSKTINGITIAVSGVACFHSTGLIDVHGDAGPNPDPDQVYAVGTFTFTSSAGKIKRIDINHNNGGLWYGAGEGWPGSYQVYDNSTFTWSGIPAASVTLDGSHKGFEFCVLYDVSSIVFTLEPTN